MIHNRIPMNENIAEADDRSPVCDAFGGGGIDLA